jgi:S1-C subfamily serine protease
MVAPRSTLASMLAAAAFTLGACGEADSPSADSNAETSTSAQTSTTEDSGGGRLANEAAGGGFDSQEIYENAGPGVVTVTSIFRGSDATASLLGGSGPAAGQGSGFVISDEGEIVTNAHVVTDATASGAQQGPLNAASEVYVQFADSNQVEAEIVGFDPFADVALLKVDPEGLDLTPLPLGSENDVEVGEGVAAIGSPFGELQSQSLSVGIVSASDRSIESLTDFRIDGAIQTDAAINPGNSGGPLLDAAGEVVGINQQIQTSSGGNEGVGFAVPIDLAERSIEQLRKNGEVRYAYAGVTTQPIYPQLAERLDLDVETGALVAEVVDGGPADDAGLQEGDEPIRFQATQVDAGGDVIVAVNGEAIDSNSDLPRLISLLDPGDDVTLDVIREGDEEQVEITLGERPAEAIN